MPVPQAQNFELLRLQGIAASWRVEIQGLEERARLCRSSGYQASAKQLERRAAQAQRELDAALANVEQFKKRNPQL